MPKEEKRTESVIEITKEDKNVLYRRKECIVQNQYSVDYWPYFILDMDVLDKTVYMALFVRPFIELFKIIAFSCRKNSETIFSILIIPFC